VGQRTRCDADTVVSNRHHYVIVFRDQRKRDAAGFGRVSTRCRAVAEELREAELVPFQVGQACGEVHRKMLAPRLHGRPASINSHDKDIKNVHRGDFEPQFARPARDPSSRPSMMHERPPALLSGVLSTHGGLVESQLPAHRTTQSS
jgi:hypothetical protein